MPVFVILGFDSVRLSSGLYKHELMGVRLAESLAAAEAIAASEWGEQFTYTEIEARAIEK